MTGTRSGWRCRRDNPRSSGGGRRGQWSNPTTTGSAPSFFFYKTKKKRRYIYLLVYILLDCIYISILCTYIERWIERDGISYLVKSSGASFDWITASSIYSIPNKGNVGPQRRALIIAGNSTGPNRCKYTSSSSSPSLSSFYSSVTFLDIVDIYRYIDR